MENPDLVEMTITYTKHPDGSVTKVRKVLGQEIYRGPSPCVFIPANWPWEAEDAGNRKSDEGSTQ